MVSVDKAVVARLSKDGIHFEILVDPYAAADFRKGKSVELDTILAVQDVFKDAKTGDHHTADDLEKVFKTTNPLTIAEIILKDGEIQLTTEQRREMIENKKKEIADRISKHGVNPQNGLPHPLQRIMNAMTEAKVSVDPFKPAKDQVKTTLKALEPILPIKIETLEIAIRIPMQYAGKASSHIRQLAPVKQEEWKADAWIAVIEIPAGMQSDVLSRLNDITSGSIETKIVKRKES